MGIMASQQINGICYQIQHQTQYILNTTYSSINFDHSKLDESKTKGNDQHGLVDQMSHKSSQTFVSFVLDMSTRQMSAVLSGHVKKYPENVHKYP
jgi:hypothetical protein